MMLLIHKRRIRHAFVSGVSKKICANINLLSLRHSQTIHEV